MKNYFSSKKVYLFAKFPYDYKTIPPVDILDGVVLERKFNPSLIYSHSTYQENKHLRPYEYVLPAINMFPLPNVSIQISLAIHNPDQLFWTFMLALRLIKNLEINVSGSFIYSEEDPCASPTLYNIATQINFNPNNDSYNFNDFVIAAELVNKIISLQNQEDQFKRLTHSIVLFAQVATGRSTSYQMMYLALWSSLDGLLGSPGEAKNLSATWKDFFKDQINNFDEISTFIEKRYANGRNLLSHGNVQFWKNYTENQDVELAVLYDIVKITILGFIGLTNEELRKISVNSAKKIQNAIRCNKASRYYLDKLDINLIDLRDLK